jgi:hypothetical protein
MPPRTKPEPLNDSCRRLDDEDGVLAFLEAQRRPFVPSCPAGWPRSGWLRSPNHSSMNGSGSRQAHLFGLDQQALHRAF